MKSMGQRGLRLLVATAAVLANALVAVAPASAAEAVKMVNAGFGLSGGGGGPVVNLAVDPSQIQVRVSGVCASGFAMRAIAGDGTVTCVPVGTITAVNAGAGLTGGGSSGVVTLGVTNGGITNSMLANPALSVLAGTGLSGGGSVALGGSTTLGIANGGVGTAQLATGAVTTGKLSASGSSAGQVLTSDGTNVSWQSPSAANAWSLSGNAGTDPSTNFLGTSDNVALELKVNGSRALRLEPGLLSPNLIGGYAGNSVSAFVYGATIGGGGASGDANSVSNTFGTVAGGENNTVSGQWASVAGGVANTASGVSAGVAGGAFNTASGDDASVAGGGGTTAKRPRGQRRRRRREHRQRLRGQRRRGRQQHRQRHRRPRRRRLFQHRQRLEGQRRRRRGQHRQRRRGQRRRRLPQHRQRPRRPRRWRRRQHRQRESFVRRRRPREGVPRGLVRLGRCSLLRLRLQRGEYVQRPLDRRRPLRLGDRRLRHSDGRRQPGGGRRLLDEPLRPGGEEGNRPARLGERAPAPGRAADLRLELQGASRPQSATSGRWRGLRQGLQGWARRRAESTTSTPRA